MSCVPAGLAALAGLTSLETLEIHSLRYREQSPAGKWLYEVDTARIRDRIWELIRARRRGEDLPAHWLAERPPTDAERAAAREAKIKRLMVSVEALREQARRLEAQAAALLEHIEELRAEGER